MKSKLFLVGSTLLVVALARANSIAKFGESGVSVVDKFLSGSGIFAVVDSLSGAVGTLGNFMGGERPLTEGPTSRRTTVDAAPINTVAGSFN